jgi:uridine kinase
MNGEPISWLARSKNSKEWHEENLNKFKERKVTLFPRYINSPGTDFDKILGGYDNITNNTHTLVIVEGLFDYINLSNLLKTNLYEEMKVIFTFGNKISDNQINLLRKKKSIKNIILMYDYNTIKQSKRYSLLLSKYYDVDICEIKDPDVDPGNMSESYLSDLLINKKNFLYFYTSKI